MLQQIFAWYSVQRNAVKAILIFFGTMVVIYLFYLLTLVLVKDMGKGVMEPIYLSDRTMKNNMDAVKKPGYLPVEYFTVLKSQYNILNIRKEHHVRLALIFF